VSTAGETGGSLHRAMPADSGSGTRTSPYAAERHLQQQAVAATRPQTAQAYQPTRRVKLTVARIDPWSAMKMSFLVSVALGIAGVVMVAVLWMILSGMGVFSELNRVIGQIATDGDNTFDLMDYIGFGRVVSLSIVIGVIDVILLTAISTLAAFLYNVCASLVGGLQLTLTDD
jgi:Transmembrane domain of unknown function (DUF3566)